MDIGTALVGVSNAITIAKQLIALSSVAKDAQATLLVADLQLQLAEVKTRMAELMEEKLSLAEELKKSRSDGAELVYKDGQYYTHSGDGPFCQMCHDRDGKRIRVQLAPAHFRQFGRWYCGACKNTSG